MYCNNNYFIKLVLIILIFVKFTIQSQELNQETNWPEPIFEHFTLADGLPENSVVAIMQDHLGYLWLGTQFGLARYDGYNIKDFQSEQSWGSTIVTMYEDKSGTIWIGTLKGLDRFNPVTATVTRFRQNLDDFNSISPDSINCIIDAKNGNILVGANKGLYLFNSQNQNFRNISYKDSIYSHRVSAFLEDRLSGNVYVSTKNNVLIFDREKGVLTDSNRINKLISTIGSIHSFCQSGDGLIWIGHSMGLSRLDLQNNTIKHYQVIKSSFYNDKNYFQQLVEDDNGFLWLISGSGENGSLMIFDPRSEKFKHFEHHPDKPNSISSSKNVWSVYKDRSGIIWVGTLLGGLNKWDRNKYKFKSYCKNSKNSVDGDFERVRSIVEDSKGIIWFGTQNGLNSFDRKWEEFRNYKFDANAIDNTVTYIYKDNTGIIWLGTETSGLVSFDPIENTNFFYSHDPKNPTSISHNTIRYILPENNDFLWVGTRGGGLNKFNKRTGDFIRYLPEDDNPQSLSNERVECIIHDRKGTMWVATQGIAGLNRFDYSNNTFKSFSFFGGGPVALAIHEDRKGNLWVGTLNKGISLFNRVNETFGSNYNLANNLVRSILEDDSGNLWIGTDNGLSKFDPNSQIIKNYSTSYNFEGNRYSANSAFKTSTGEMLFGTYDGFIIFHPDSIKDDPVPPQVIITDVSLFNRTGEELEYEGFISDLKKLNLSYNENDLRFDYVGLHFADPSKNKYKYMLEGYEKQWVDAGTQRNATYTNLDAGEYVFRVKACNLDGVWNEEGASLSIIISPPFWATWWAYIIYFLLGVSIVYFLRKYEMNRLGLKNQVKLDELKLKEREETDKMKSRFFANISHEFRTPLTLILGPAENIRPDSSADEVEKQTGMIKRNAQRLMNLINQLLDLSKLEAGKLKLKASKNNIVSFVRGIVMSFESLAERKDISLKVHSDHEVIELYFDKDMMIKILTNLLSNAFKFTPEGGSITVSLKPPFNSPFTKGGKEGGSVAIVVKDTGIGISDDELPKLFDRFYQVDSSQTREYEGSGLGLALIKELIELHHGSIRVNSKVDSGSEFIVELPDRQGSFECMMK